MVESGQSVYGVRTGRQYAESGADKHAAGPFCVPQSLAFPPCLC
jgi:hypothetical protein